MDSLFQGLLRSAGQLGSKSTALSPLGWLVAILGAALVGFQKYTAPTWLNIIVATCLSCSVLSYLLAYGYLVVKDRDSLRSESFRIEMFKIERSERGDSAKGFGKQKSVRKRSKSIAKEGSYA